jgi:hypothetical protein
VERARSNTLAYYGQTFKGIRAVNAQMPVRGHDSPFFAIVYRLDFKKTSLKMLLTGRNQSFYSNLPLVKTGFSEMI